MNNILDNVLYYIKINNETISFNKINDVLYSYGCHLYFNINYLNNNSNSNKTNKLIDYERLIYNSNNNLTNPKYLFVSLYCNSKHKITFGIFNNTNKTNNNYSNFNWTFINNYIYNQKHKLYLNIYKNKLIVSKYKYKWDIENNIIKHRKSNLYISCNFEYKIFLTLDKTKAISFYIDNNSLHFFKSNTRVQFELNNIKNDVKINKFMNNIYNINNINTISNKHNNNICILLSAGISSRFNASYNINSSIKYKQLHIIDNKPIILYSIEHIIDNVDNLIIITNSKCYNDINNIININYNNEKICKIIILINDINCRLESINTGLNYINNKYNNNDINNIIIHDVARPFIKQEYIQTLLNNDNNDNLYSQYYLRLTNGLMYLDSNINEIVDRDKYIELCTPLCINYKLFNFIFTNYIQKENMITYEFIPILKILNIQCNFIEGHYKYLRKITTFEDI
jgi:2-C-methyl-D-erythritol 4-phosphate cytidylyltransferase